MTVEESGSFARQCCRRYGLLGDTVLLWMLLQSARVCSQLAELDFAGKLMLALDPVAHGKFWFDGFGLVTSSADTMLEAEPPTDMDSLLCLFRITTRPLSGICAPHPYSLHAYACRAAS